MQPGGHYILSIFPNHPCSFFALLCHTILKLPSYGMWYQQEVSKNKELIFVGALRFDGGYRESAQKHFQSDLQHKSPVPKHAAEHAGVFRRNTPCPPFFTVAFYRLQPNPGKTRCVSLIKKSKGQTALRFFGLKAAKQQDFIRNDAQNSTEQNACHRV